MMRWHSLIALCLAPGLLWGAEPNVSVERGTAPSAEDRTVELFAGIQAGELEAKFIPKDSTVGRILVTNKTNRPLNVELPEAFAGVPVLAQFPPFNNQNQGQNQNQAVGGGMNNNLNFQGNNNNFFGGPMFNIPAEKVGEIKVGLVCLEHGKNEPRPAMQYELKPLEEFSQNAKLKGILKQFAAGKISQRVAQAAAWHLSNGMSWKELADKRIRRASGATRRYFHPQEIKSAMAAVFQAGEKQPSEDPGKATSLSQR